MKTITKFLLLVALILVLSACNVPQATPALPTASPTLQIPTATAQLPTPTAEPQQPTPVAAPAYSGFVVFDNANKEFLTYDLAGQLVSRVASGPGLEYPSSNYTEFAGQDVYFFSTLDKKLFRANQSGVQFLENLSVENLYAFVISPDGSQIAWSTFIGTADPITSELWIASLDGSNARKIISYNADQSQGPGQPFLLIPLEWRADGKIMFDRSPTGFGGYIPYGGHNSLYSYEPQTEQFTTYVPAEEMHGLCLDSYRLDLNKVVFHCGEQHVLTIRSLNDSTETYVAVSDMYQLAGGSSFSPAGTWLAYGAAKGDPEHEAGQLLVAPLDMSTPPQEITTTDQGYFTVLAWLDEDTMLVSRSGTSTATIMKLSRDGKQSQELAQGLFLGMLP